MIEMHPHAGLHPLGQAGPARRIDHRPVPGGEHRPSQPVRSEEHTSELQSRPHLVCRLLLEKKKTVSITSPCRAPAAGTPSCPPRASTTRRVPRALCTSRASRSSARSPSTATPTLTTWSTAPWGRTVRCADCGSSTSRSDSGCWATTTTWSSKTTASSTPPPTASTRKPTPAAFFFFNDTATTEIYTLSLHDALPI